MTTSPKMLLPRFITEIQKKRKTFERRILCARFQVLREKIHLRPSSDRHEFLAINVSGFFSFDAATVSFLKTSFKKQQHFGHPYDNQNIFGRDKLRSVELESCL